MSDPREIKTTWTLVTESRDAAQKTREMITLAESLEQREKRLTEAAKKRVDARRELVEIENKAKQIAPDLYERELTAEERYQQKFKSRLDMIRENLRLQEDLRKAQTRSISEMVAEMDAANRNASVADRRERLAKVSAFAQYGIGAADVLGQTREKALEAAGYSRRDNGPSADRAKSLYGEYTEQKPGMIQQFWNEGRLQQFAKFAVGASLAEKGIVGLSKAIDLFNNETQSVTAKIVNSYRSIASEIPIIGGLHKAGENLGDSIFFGSQRRAMNKEREMYDNGRAVGDIQYQRAFRDLQSSRDMSISRFTPSVAASVASGLNAPMLAGQSFGIGGAGFRALDQRLTGPSMEIIQIRGEIEKNKFRELEFQADKYKLQKQYDNLELGIRRLESERNSGKITDFQYVRYGYQIKQLQDRRSAIGSELYGIEREIGDTRKSGAGLRRSLREQQTQRLGGELDITRERVESRIDARQQFAGLSAGDQMGIAMALDRAKRNGYDSLTQEERDSLKGNALTSNWARMQERDYSARNPTIAGIEKQVFNAGEDTESLMAKQRRLEQELAKEKQSALEDAAKDAAQAEVESIRGVFGALVEQFMTQISKIKEDLVLSQSHGRTQ